MSSTVKIDHAPNHTEERLRPVAAPQLQHARRLPLLGWLGPLVVATALSGCVGMAVEPDTDAADGSVKPRTPRTPENQPKGGEDPGEEQGEEPGEEQGEKPELTGDPDKWKPEWPSQAPKSTGEPSNPVEPFECSADAKTGYRGVRLLTRDQYQNTIKDLFGYSKDVRSSLPPDASSGAFLNNNYVNLNDGSYTNYLIAASEVAAEVATRGFKAADAGDKNQLTLTCSPADAACEDQFLDKIGSRLFRRPLTAAEKTDYKTKVFAVHKADPKKAMELALTSMLSSPQFLYRHELGEPVAGRAGVYELTQFELATFLSYSFAGTTPDSDLYLAAEGGKLQTPAQIQAQATRLLQSARASGMFNDLVQRWLGTQELEKAMKDQEIAPNFAELVPLMKEELSRNFTSAMLAPESTFADLFTPGYTHVNDKLAKHYGLSGASGADFKKVTTKERGGLLLTGAFLSRYGHPDMTNPVTRAVHIRRDLLCQDIPEPPAGVSLSVEGTQKENQAFFNAPTTTTRMRFTKLTQDSSACQSCHAEIINPLGFGLEDFDTVGRKRTKDENGNPIIAKGALFSPFMQLQFFTDKNRVWKQVPFEGGSELTELIVQPTGEVGQLARSCLAKQMVSFATGLDARSIGASTRENVVSFPEGEYQSYNCDVETLVKTLSTSGPRKMVEELAVLDSVRFRQNWVREELGK